jgi:hypothetical protein
MKRKTIKKLAGKEDGEDTTALEAQINKMVYELYNLTDEEIAYIEESVR